MDIKELQNILLNLGLTPTVINDRIYLDKPCGSEYSILVKEDDKNYTIDVQNCYFHIKTNKEIDIVIDTLILVDFYDQNYLVNILNNSIINNPVIDYKLFNDKYLSILLMVSSDDITSKDIKAMIKHITIVLFNAIKMLDITLLNTKNTLH